MPEVSKNGLSLALRIRFGDAGFGRWRYSAYRATGVSPFITGRDE
jgi:hypothetical protein